MLGHRADGARQDLLALVVILPASLSFPSPPLRKDKHGWMRVEGLVDRKGKAVKEAVTVELPEWPTAERLAHEKELLGFYVSGHPLDSFKEDLKRLCSGTLAHFATQAQGTWK